MIGTSSLWPNPHSSRLQLWVAARSGWRGKIGNCSRTQFMIFLDPGSSNRTSLSPLSCLLAAHQLIRGQGCVLNWRGGRTQIFNMDQSSKSLTVQSKTWVLLKIIKKRCVLITKRQVTKIGKSQDGETAEDLVATCAHLFNQRRPALMVKWLLSSNFLPICSLFGNTFSLFKGILRGICYGETLYLNIIQSQTVVKWHWSPVETAHILGQRFSILLLSLDVSLSQCDSVP